MWFSISKLVMTRTYIHPSIQKCKTIFTSKRLMQKHMTENHIEKGRGTWAREQNKHEKNHTLKKRKLTWPCLVLSEAGKILKIKSFKGDKIFEKKRSDVPSFDIENIGETKTHKLKKAYSKAEAILKLNTNNNFFSVDLIYSK